MISLFLRKFKTKERRKFLNSKLRSKIYSLKKKFFNLLEKRPRSAMRFNTEFASLMIYRFWHKKSFKLIKKYVSKVQKLHFFIRKRTRLMKKRFRTKNKLAYRKYSLRRFQFSPKFCIIKQTTSNIFVTLLDVNGSIFLTCSGGNFKIKKKRQIKSTSTAIKLAGAVLKALRWKKGFLVYLIISYPIKSFILRSFLHTVKKNPRLKIQYLINLQKFAHNGCRFRKKKRN